MEINYLWMHVNEIKRRLKLRNRQERLGPKTWNPSASLLLYNITCVHLCYLECFSDCALCTLSFHKHSLRLWSLYVTLTLLRQSVSSDHGDTSIPG